MNNRKLFKIAVIFTFLTGLIASASADIIVDDFEDGDISEYSGQTAPFSADQTDPYAGNFSLHYDDSDSDSEVIASTSGLNQYPQAGNNTSFRFKWDGETGGDNIFFGVSNIASISDTDFDAYKLAINHVSDSISITKVQKDGVGGQETTLNSASATIDQNEWHEGIFRWGSNGDLKFELYDSNDNLVSEVSASDSEYTSGGIGFLDNEASASQADRFWDEIKILEETSSTNVTFSNYQPADGSTAQINSQETFTIDVSVNSTQYQTVDVEGIFDGSIETVENITADGTTQTVSFTKTFSNTGSFDYNFNVISDSPSGTPLDQSDIRTINVQTDSPEFTLNEPADNTDFYRLTTPYDAFFNWSATASQDEDTSFDLIIERPDSSTTNPVSTTQPAGQSFTDESTYDVGTQTGTYTWYIEATGVDSGETFTSTQRTFTMNQETATVNLIEPQATRLGTYTLDVKSSSATNFIGQDSSISTSFGFKSGVDNDLSNNQLFNDYSGRVSNNQSGVSEFETMEIFYDDNLNLTEQNHFINILYNLEDTGDDADSELILQGPGYDRNNNGLASWSIGSNSDGWANISITENANNYEFNYTGNVQTVAKSSLDNGITIGFESSTNAGAVTGINQEIYAIEHNIESDNNQEGSKAYVTDLPFNVDITANTENDQVVNAEFKTDGTTFSTEGVVGDGTTQNFKKTQTFADTVYNLSASVEVLGSDGQTTIGSQSVTVDVVQPPEFNLIKPKNDVLVNIDDAEKGEDFTQFEGEVTVGESGTGTIRLKPPNGTYSDIITRDFTRSDVGNTFTVKGEELVDNIQLSLDSQQLKNLSEEYEWSMAFNGSDSDQRFTHTESNFYRYGEDIETFIDKVVGWFQDKNEQFKDALGEAGQFFVATIIILILAGITELWFSNEIISISTMVLFALGFSFADGYYPIAVFWILAAVVGIAAAYFGSRSLGGE